MDEKLKKKFFEVKDFVDRHRTSVAVAATSVAWIIINRKALSQHDAYLKEHGLYDDYYNRES